MAIDFTQLTKGQRAAVTAYQQIKLNPQSWNQNAWRSAATDEDEDGDTCSTTRCGARLCFMGQVVQNDGARWFTDNPDEDYFQYMHVRDGDDIEDLTWVHTYLKNSETVKTPVISVLPRATQILGFPRGDSGAYTISRGENTLDDLRRYIKEFMYVDPENGMLLDGYGNPIKNYENELLALGKRPEHSSDVYNCPSCTWTDKKHDLMSRYGRDF